MYIQFAWNVTVIDDGEIDGDSEITSAFSKLLDSRIVATIRLNFIFRVIWKNRTEARQSLNRVGAFPIPSA